MYSESSKHWYRLIAEAVISQQYAEKCAVDEIFNAEK